MKRLLALIPVAMCSLVCVEATARDWTRVDFSESPARIAPAVDYLCRPPVIDGRLDDDLADLPLRGFSHVWKSSPDNPTGAASWRIAYGAHFLYVYVEAESDGLTFRDRAYQNGDGFTVVLARPRPDNAPSEEFHVLACSAVDRQDMEWTRTIFWYYNVDNIFLPTSDEMTMEFSEGDGVVRFEVLIPWQDVHPHHPWLDEGTGFNLGVALAVGEEQTNHYRVVDASIGAENSPRGYALLDFEEPRHEGDALTFVRPVRGNIGAGDALAVETVTIASGPFAEKLSVGLVSGEKTNVGFTRESFDCAAGLTRRTIAADSHRLPAGGYTVEWRTADGRKGERGLSILPSLDTVALEKRLEEAKDPLSPGSLETLRFMLAEIGADLAEIHPYETAAPQRLRLTQVVDCIAAAERGADVFAEQRGFVRMAYRSGLDDTLQPYVVYLPEDFDPARSYPLVVFLHGSASTEYNIVGWSGIPEGFIGLGPKGRGPSNWYSWDDSQTDIAEAVDAVRANFPIDDDRILLAGFSMGGYGVYRTYYETPETYSAIAVFSGRPSVGFGIPEGVEVIDFNDGKHLESFDGLPVFVFHGERDMNVPFAETERFISTLEGAGARVEFRTEKDKGHESANDESMAAYRRWVDEVFAD